MRLIRRGLQAECYFQAFLLISLLHVILIRHNSVFRHVGLTWLIEISNTFVSISWAFDRAVEKSHSCFVCHALALTEIRRRTSEQEDSKCTCSVCFAFAPQRTGSTSRTLGPTFL